MGQPTKAALSPAPKPCQPRIKSPKLLALRRHDFYDLRPALRAELHLIFKNHSTARALDRLNSPFNNRLVTLLAREKQTKSLLHFRIIHLVSQIYAATAHMLKPLLERRF